MDQLVGTQNCPHLGFDLQRGRPCCHADDQTRTACGKAVPNPAAANAILGVEPWFCTVLGTDSLPPEALRLAAQQKAQAKAQTRAQRPAGFQPPRAVSGQTPAKPSREQAEDQDPVIPTHTLRHEDRQTPPNAPCPCGSGKKHKKCCGRTGG